MSDAYKQPYIDFETMDDSDYQYCCKIAMPAKRLFSQRFATKRSAFGGIETQRELGNITNAEVLKLRREVFASELPDADAELEYMLDEIETLISRFRRLVEQVADEDRGIVEGDEWRLG